MDWLIHNAIADMYGPSFLVVYVVTAIVTIVFARSFVRSLDRTGLRPPPPVPGVFNPYEIAYLRGGKNEVIRTVLYFLHQRGFVEVAPGKRLHAPRLAWRADRSDTEDLTELENRVLLSLRRPLEVSGLFRHTALVDDFEELCRPFRQNLESQDLLHPAYVRQAALRILLLAGGFLVALSLYKILIAVNKGLSNVGFLIVLTFISLILLWVMAGRIANAPISDRGKAYLKRLQVAYAASRQPAAPRTGEEPQPENASVLLVGLFGLAVLSGSSDAAFATLFTRGTSGSGGGCGGGSSGCGGGASGGCGGCGGGGGGGCGGGN